MEIYLIRHTTPDIGKGICYGQTDMDVSGSFLEEANGIKALLPEGIQKVFSSPLRRCRKLAEYLFPGTPAEYMNGLKEISCGEWEGVAWNSIAQEELDMWMSDFVNIRYPCGENFLDLYKRASETFRQIELAPLSTVAVVTHSGIIRCLLSMITNTPLAEAFTAFKLNYSSVVVLKGDKGEYEFRLLN